MSEASTETQQPAEQGQEPTGQEQATPETQDVTSLPQWARDAISKANGEAAKYRTQVRDLEPKAKQFTALEEASKSETQRLQESVEAANRARDEAAADALRYRIAAEHGIGKDDLDLLGVGDEDALTARATRIAEMRAATRSAEEAAAAKPAQQRPTEQLRPGATPSTEQASDDDRFFESIYGAKP
jgi:hypothetical protein